MSHILAAIDDPTENDPLLDAAVRRAREADARLVVATIVPTSEYDARRTALARSRDLRSHGPGYTYTQACDEAKAATERAIDRVLADREVDTLVVADVGALLPTALDYAEAYECSTVLVGERTRLRDRLGLTRWLRGSRFRGAIEHVPSTVRTPHVGTAAPFEA